MYEGLRFKVSLRFPPSYPHTAPTVTFDSKCFHPNVDDHGNICLDILKVRLSLHGSGWPHQNNSALTLPAPSRKRACNGAGFVGTRPRTNGPPSTTYRRSCCRCRASWEVRLAGVAHLGQRLRSLTTTDGPSRPARELSVPPSEPNNASPLNVYAAELWANQTGALGAMRLTPPCVVACSSRAAPASPTRLRASRVQTGPPGQVHASRGVI